MFASKSLVEHLARGTVGVGALAAAVGLLAAQPWLALAALVASLVALRGCPMCWTVGLMQTVAAKARGAAPAGRCPGGSCARTERRLSPGPTARGDRAEPL